MPFRARRTDRRAVVVVLAVALLGLGDAAQSRAIGAGRTDRLVVRMTEPDTELKRAQPDAERMDRLALRAGVPLAPLRPLFNGARVLALPQALPVREVAAMAQRIAADPEVLYAEPDYRVEPAQAAANDPWLAFQPYLQSRTPYTGAVAAWEVARGSPVVAVAVVDSGTLAHRDLQGRILPGYDFIRDPGVANDGDGRDRDASDPGDWVSLADLDREYADEGCSQHASSWHGTAVAGVIGAVADNGIGIAGIDWRARILPVRALGKCGGYASDVADAIVWSAGVPVPDAPPNPMPAQVINLSLGGEGPCGFVYLEAIQAALARGVRAVVAAAGNHSRDADRESPANCPGVIAVASTTDRGRLASYSNYGPAVTLAAPGGDFQPQDGEYQITVLTDIGLTVPRGDGYRATGGTSFAAAMVSATVSLMLAVNPELTATRVRDLLVSTARPFIDSSCSGRCGAGYLATDAAVRRARETLLLPAAAPPGTEVAVEFYHALLDHYFLTPSADEMWKLDSGFIAGWIRTGQSFLVHPASAAAAGTQPVCRFYGRPEAGLESHFYTPFEHECRTVQQAMAASWQLESDTVFRIAVPDGGGRCPGGTDAVYRLYNGRYDANHRYTVRRDLRDRMLELGWVVEGVGSERVLMCAVQR